MTITQFAWGYYFPGYVADLKPSVRQPYECNWKKHLEPLCGNIRLRDFRTNTGQRVILEVAGKGIGRNTVRRLKSLLSGIFSEAIRQGALDGSNPMREVRIPTRRLPPPNQTHAYGLDEISKMLKFFGRPVRTLIGLAAFAGLRKGELAGVCVEDWRDGNIWVERSVWRKYITEPKSAKSTAPVPVIAPLRELLQEHCRDRTAGLMFQSRKGTPLNLDNLAKDVVQPGLAEIGLPWYGWHAFRRGLATNLKQIGVDDKTIQAILRHADYTTTMNHYVLSVPESVRTAMKRFEMFVCNYYATETKAKIA